MQPSSDDPASNTSLRSGSSSFDNTHSPSSLKSSPFGELPVELTPLIIHHALPPRKSTTLSERRDLLKTFCLVSSSWRRYAQALLYEQIATPVRSDVADLSYRLEGRHQDVQALHVRAGNVGSTSYHHLKGMLQLLKKCTGLEEVFVDSPEFIGVARALSEIEHLKKLHLNCSQSSLPALHLPPPLVFNSVTRLSLYMATADTFFILSSLKFPSVTTLSLSRCGIHSDAFAKFFSSLSHTLQSLLLNSLRPDEEVPIYISPSDDINLQEHFFRQCQNLKHLTVTSTSHLFMSAPSLRRSLVSLRLAGSERGIEEEPYLRIFLTILSASTATIDQVSYPIPFSQALSADDAKKWFGCLGELRRLVVPVMKGKGVCSEENRKMLQEICERRGIYLEEVGEMENMEELVSE